MPLPLAGIRVIDTSSVFAMPYTAGIMADLGAEVIKIEALQRLDQTRGSAWGLWPDNDPGERPWDRGGAFCTLNRGKRSLVLDLSKEEGRAIFRDLVRASDIVIENYTARVMRGWELDYAKLSAIRPDIIHVSNTGYGHNSPWESYPVQGTSLEPMTGICHFSGYIGDRPWKIAQSYPDFLAMWHALFCIMSALRHRALTGQGQWIDVGMYQVSVSCLGEAMLDYAANGRLGARIGNRDHTGAVQGCYQCLGDERWLTVTARDDEEWRRLRDLAGTTAWDGTAPPATLAEAYARHDEVDAALSAWAAQREREEAVESLRAVGLPAGPVEDARDLLLDPHLQSRGFYQMVEHDPVSGVGRRPVIGQPWKLSKTPVSIRRPAPPLGEANAFILEDLLGLPAERFARLVAEGLTGELDAPLETPNPVPLAEQLRLGRFHGQDPAYRERLRLEQEAGVGTGL
jgi:crotonobetainyl-CoA:carnitine CoA-transferase CaiB-like acyl-CoA transferase